MDAGVFLASVVYYGNFGVRRDAAAGIARWRKLAATDVRWARNNLALGPVHRAGGKLRDAAAGLAIADTMEASAIRCRWPWTPSLPATPPAAISPARWSRTARLDLAQKQNPALESFIARARAHRRLPCRPRLPGVPAGTARLRPAGARRRRRRTARRWSAGARTVQPARRASAASGADSSPRM